MLANLELVVFSEGENLLDRSEFLEDDAESLESDWVNHVLDGDVENGFLASRRRTVSRTKSVAVGSVHNSSTSVLTSRQRGLSEGKHGGRLN